MFKKAVLFTGFFVIAACSGDIYDEIDQQNEQLTSEQNANNNGMQTNSFEDSNPGWINLPGGGGAPFINPGDGYQSPWDIWFRNKPYTPNYAFSNRGGGGHTSPLTIRITPWVGLAYFDGANDGFYNDDDLLLNNPPGLVANFNGGGFPNLYANGKEVGNLVPAKPFILDGTTMAQSELSIASDWASSNPKHLLSPTGFSNPAAYNPNNITFQFPGLLPQERDLLAQYGKVFYFEVDVTETATSMFLGKFFVQVENNTLDDPAFFNPNWITANGIQANVPGGAGLRDVFYYHNTTPGILPDTQWDFPYPISTPTGPNPDYICNSREVVIKQAYSNKYTFTYNGAPWEVWVVMAIGSHLWLTSGPFLVVQPQ